MLFERKAKTGAMEFLGKEYEKTKECILVRLFCDIIWIFRTVG